MVKVFNVTGACKPDKHYMVKLDKRLAEIKKLVDDGAYFMIHCARQYGKTTTLRALNKYLLNDYYVVMIDFQTFDAAKFENGNIFSISFANSFLRAFKSNSPILTAALQEACDVLKENAGVRNSFFTLKELFEGMSDICAAADRPIVLMIDEVDSATNNQVFLDFLAQLRAYYIDRDVAPTFGSVILAGVHDIKNLKRKLRPEDEHKVNSPWNIAADFKIDMNFTAEEIVGMLQQYEEDYHTGMDICLIAKLMYDYTSGYPFLVSRLCKLLDEEVYGKEDFDTKRKAWTKTGFNEAVKIFLTEKNTLFESLIGKLINDPELSSIIQTVLFTGKPVAYNADTTMLDVAAMYGFIKNRNGCVAIANRLFETRLYNFYLSTAEVQSNDIYVASLRDKNQFIVDGHLNMRRILERFVLHFNELYGSSDEAFIEEEGRKYFLLYLRPIINGVGNYYIESRTRELRRTDIILDYHGEQYIIEMKIWRGEEYNNRGEQQLIGYLEDYHQNKGYMVSFNFNKNKQIGVQEIVVGDKVLIEAVV